MGLWDRYAIVAEIHRRGLTLVGLAQAAGLEPSACKVAVLRRNYAGERAIADALGIEPAVLWPDRYPVSTSHHQRTRNRRVRASQKRVSA